MSSHKKAGATFPKPRTGALLISEPFNSDPDFKRAVILISQHDRHGSIGFVLNKPTNLKVHEVLEDFPEFNAPVYWGGGLSLDSVFYVHSIPDLAECVPIANGIFWGGNYEQLKMMIETKQVTTEQIKFVVGYAGWSPRQLQKEIKQNDWWVGESDTKTIFVESPEIVWGKTLQRMGHVYGIMNNFPEDPSVN